MKTTQNNRSITQLAYDRIEHFRTSVMSDPHRLHYHLMPPVGLLNDPNGFVYYKGKYHVFYQWNPFDTRHGVKFWGHYSSDDLTHWEAEPIALAPDQWFDKDGCYSGSAVVVDEKMILFYTGNVKDNDTNRKSYQCIAVSEDGNTFDKKGPIIYQPEGYTSHIRDPKVFEKDGKWIMILGAQTLEEKGEVILYTSENLEQWTWRGPIAGSGRNGLGDFGYMWECPDLFELDGTDILIVSPQGLQPMGYEYNNLFQSGYFEGTMNYEHANFAHGQFTELDRGFDFYAPQTTLDAEGRRVLIAWMGSADEAVNVEPTIEYGWVHALTIPRQLQWRQGKLIQTPVEELKQLRTNELHMNEISCSADKREFFSGNVYEMLITIKEWNATVFSMELGQQTRIVYDQEKQIFTFERASIKDGKLESRSCQLDELTQLHVFKDTSSIEIFLNGGQEVFTSKVFDRREENSVTVMSKGTVKLELRKWELKRVCK